MHLSHLGMSLKFCHKSQGALQQFTNSYFHSLITVKLVTTQVPLQQLKQMTVWSGKSRTMYRVEETRSSQWSDCSNSCVWCMLCGVAFSYQRVRPCNRCPGLVLLSGKLRVPIPFQLVVFHVSKMLHQCPITCHCGTQELISIFFKPPQMWKSNLKTSIFALFWHLGKQRAHILQHPSLLWTVFMCSSDGQFQHSGIILNCDFSVCPEHLLHSYCNKVHPWCARQTSEIIMDIQWITFELSITF
jgi:hypothetical protein